MLNWDAIFSKFHRNYRKALALLNPKYDETSNRGFNKRNLLVNFVEAYKAVCAENPDDVAAWYDMPIKKVKKGEETPEMPNLGGSVDAVIYDKPNNAFIYVKYQKVHCDKKEEEAKGELEKLIKISKKGCGKRICNQEATEYAVIISDVWNKQKQKQELIERWKNKEIFDVKGDYFTKGLKVGETSKDNYILLGFVLKV